MAVNVHLHGEVDGNLPNYYRYSVASIVLVGYRWIMTKKEKSDVKKSCDACSDAIDYLADLAIGMFGQKKQVQKVTRALAQMEQDPENKFPEGWFLSQMNAYVVTEVFSEEKHIKAIKREIIEENNPKNLLMLDTWQENPMRWAPFVIEEKLGDDFFTIFDFENEGEELLYSPALTKLQREEHSRDKRYIVLRIFTGECWITYGPYHYYQFGISELIQWASLLDKAMFENNSYSQFVKKHFLDFFLIDDIMMIPSIGHRNELMHHCIRIFENVEIDESALPGSWERTEAGSHLVKLEYKGISEAEMARITVPAKDLASFHKTLDAYWDPQTMRFPTLYIDKEMHTLMLDSMAPSGYDLLYRLVKTSHPTFDPSKKMILPEWDFDVSMDTLFRTHSHLSTPWQAFTKPFEGKTSAKDDNSEGMDMSGINEALSALQDAFNNGTSVDKDKIAEKSGLSVDTIESLQESLSSLLAKQVPAIEIPIVDLEYELDIPEPPPAQKRLFRNSLYDSALFNVHDDDAVEDMFEVMTGGKFNDDLDEVGIIGIVSELFEEAFAPADITIMNSFFHLLLERGEQWIPVRSYAVMVYKWFGNTILPSLGVDYDGFMEEFSTFVVRKLCSHAMCEVQERPSKEDRARGTYLVRGTICFQDFIERS